MSNKVKDIDIKNQTYYFFNDVIDIKKLIKTVLKQMKSHTKIFTFITLDMTIKYSKYVKLKSVNLLYFITSKVNGYFKEIDGNNYLMLVPTTESEEKNLKK